MCDSDYLSISAPASLLEELRYLRCLSTAGLSNNDSDLASFDQVEQTLSMLRYRQQSRRLIKCWDEGRAEFGLCHVGFGRALRISVVTVIEKPIRLKCR